MSLSSLPLSLRFRLEFTTTSCALPKPIPLLTLPMVLRLPYCEAIAFFFGVYLKGFSSYESCTIAVFLLAYDILKSKTRYRMEILSLGAEIFQAI